MSVFLIFRAAFFVLFVLIHGAICATAAVNITDSRESAIRSLDIYLIFYSSASILFMFPLVLIEVLRHGAVTSSVRFESIWLLLSWMLNISGASASMALVPTPSCKRSVAASCSAARALVPVTWTATFLVLAYLSLLVVMSSVYSGRHPEVWTTSVRDFQWFNGGGSSKSEQLASGPPSPAFVARQLTLNSTVTHLERMAETWQPPSASTQVRSPAMSVTPLNRPAPEPVRSMEPQPLTLANAPELPPRAPVHYTASAVVSVGVLPGRRSSTKKPKTTPAQAPPALYPSYVLNATSQRNTSAPETITFTSPLQVQGSSQAAKDEPLPIRNWPRVNPQEPFRKHRTSNTPVVKSMQTQAVSLGTPGLAPAPSAPAPTSPPTRRSSGSRRRPPPLDLSAASPARLR